MNLPAFPKPTETWHSKAYPSINPQRPELSQKGKVICITGGGGTVGKAIALAFAQAGAQIALLGRRLEMIETAKSEIETAVPGVNIEAVHCDIADAESVDTAFGRVKDMLCPIDILICCAGAMAPWKPLLSADPQRWWQSYEVNVRGAFNCVRAYAKHAASNSILIDVSTGLVHLPAIPTASAHTSSNLAATKVYETFGAENPSVQVVHIQPGAIASEMSVATETGYKGGDNPDLPGGFLVWLCSPEGEFLRRKGKYLWANWDVDELKSRADELSEATRLTISLQL